MIVALNNKSNLTKQEFLLYQDNLKSINCTSKLILCASPLNIGEFNLSNCHLGGQNVSKTTEGAHTGEIAASQLKSYSVDYCIVGHSERRMNQNETNEDIALKIRNLYAEGIIPILCVGETKDERDDNKLKEIIEQEIKISTNDLTNEQKSKLIIAYEPIWSIGTGLIPTIEQIQESIKLIKDMLPNTKVLYGGSANEKNIDELKKCSLIDGYLLGGLSLKPEALKIFLQKLEK